MKFFNLLSVLGLVAMATACGSSQNNATYPYNYGAYGSGYGYNTGYNGYGSGGMQTPLYGSNGQIIGYKVRTPVLGGYYPNITGTTFSQSVQVNAGDRLFVNLASASYGVSLAYCDGKLADMYKTGNQTFPLTNMAISLNGQQIGGGYGGAVTAQSSGSLTISATLNPVNVSCGWLFGNHSAQVQSYFVNLGGSGSMGSYYGSSAAVEVERCTNTSGATMACPY
jgi:hypothetical protein